MCYCKGNSLLCWALIRIFSSSLMNRSPVPRSNVVGVQRLKYLALLLLVVVNCVKADEHSHVVSLTPSFQLEPQVALKLEW